MNGIYVSSQAGSPEMFKGGERNFCRLSAPPKATQESLKSLAYKQLSRSDAFVLLQLYMLS